MIIQKWDVVSGLFSLFSLPPLELGMLPAIPSMKQLNVPWEAQKGDLD